MLRDTATGILGSLLISGSQVILPVAEDNTTLQFTPTFTGNGIPGQVA
jgi:hypothetical protein